VSALKVFYLKVTLRALSYNCQNLQSQILHELVESKKIGESLRDLELIGITSLKFE